MDSTIIIQTQGSWILQTQEQTIDLTVPQPYEFTFSTGTIGPSGVVNAIYPLQYDPNAKEISIASGYYALASDLSNYLTITDAQATYAPLISPTLQGTPLAPTASQGTATTQIATTAFVDSWFAPKANPTFTGIVTVPTATEGDNSGKASSTAFVATALSAGLATKANLVHTHSISQVIGLQTALDGKQEVGDYATNSYVDSTFQPISGMSAYYLASNPAGYITNASLGGYATENWVTSQGYETASHAASTYYLASNPSNFITSSALSGYATESWVLGKNYITSSALSPYLLSSTAASTYQPIGDYATNPYVNGTFQTLSGMSAYYLASNPSGYITNAALSGYATESWVSEKGYETATHAASTYQPIGDYATNTSLTNGLALKANVSHTHDASAIVSGVIDLARIPIIPSQVQVVSTQNSIANLTVAEQAQITGAGVLVTTTDGNRWVYSGSGSKTSEASYVKVADITPDWSEISNKPAFGTMSLEATTDWLSKAGNLSGLTSVSTARTNLGLGTMAVETATNYLAKSGNLSGLTSTSTARANLGLGSMATESASSYYLASNPAGYITNAALGGYATESWVTSKGYLTAPYNPFDQSLNKANSVEFNGVTVSDTSGTSSTAVTISNNGFYTLEYGFGYPLRTALTNNGLFLSTGSITFPDNTVQTTAYTGATNPFNQDLNTTDTVQFGGLSLVDGVSNTGVFSQPNRLELTGTSGLDGGVYASGSNVAFSLTNGTTTVQMDLGGITFPDGTTQSSAAVTPDLTPYAQKATTNTFTASQVISVADNTNAALRVTQTGTGESFRVEDSTSPDSTPFVITNDGRVGIGRQPTAGYLLDVAGNFVVAGSQHSLLLASSGVQITQTSGSASTFTITNSGTGNSFVVNDESGDTTPFVINAAGNVGIGVSNPSFALQVGGAFYASQSSYELALNSAAGVTIGTPVGGTANALTITNRGNSASFRVNDDASDTTPFIVDAGGNVGVKTATPAYDLDINGTANLTTLRFADGTTQTTAYTGATNPFDQSLNTTDSPTFDTVYVNAGVSFGAIGGLTQTQLTLSSGGSLMTVSDTSITFPDSTVQTTAFPPAGGTTAQYIDGTGVLQTFPTTFTANKVTATVYNQTGSVITKGQVVYVNGAHGKLPTVALAIATGDSTSAGTYGLVQSDIADMSSGTIVIAGVIENIDTFAYEDGDKVYLSPVTAGGWTTTKPHAPDHLVYIGVITRKHPTQGTIQLRIANGFELSELHDVQALSPSNADGIFFDDSDDQWKTRGLSYILGSGNETLGGLIKDGLVNANAPSSSNPYSTLGDVESSVNAYAASITPVLPTTDEKSALSNANLPSASNPFLTLTGTPVASETTQGIIELANKAQVETPTSTSLGLSPIRARDFARRFLLKRGIVQFQASLTTQVSGTGAGYSQLLSYSNVTPANAGIAGFARGYSIVNTSDPTHISANGGWLNFSKEEGFSQAVYLSNASSTAGIRTMMIIGEANSLTAGVALGDPTNKRIGVSHTSGGNILLMVHNGTTLTFVDSGATPPTSGSRKYYIEVIWDGTGYAEMYVKDALGNEFSCSTTNAPIGSPQSVVHSSYCLQVSSSTTHTAIVNLSPSNPAFYFA